MFWPRPDARYSTLRVGIGVEDPRHRHISVVCRDRFSGLKMYYLYILKSEKDNSFYIGATSNLKQRLKKHKQGLVKFTKSRLPIKLVHLEKFATLPEARQRELQIKKWKKRRAIENLIKRTKQSFC